MRTSNSKYKKLIPLVAITLLITLNVIAYKATKSYFTKAGYVESQELTSLDQDKDKSFKILNWTIELFRTFRNIENH